MIVFVNPQKAAKIPADIDSSLRSFRILTLFSNKKNKQVLFSFVNIDSSIIGKNHLM